MIYLKCHWWKDQAIDGDIGHSYQHSMVSVTTLNDSETLINLLTLVSGTSFGFTRWLAFYNVSITKSTTKSSLQQKQQFANESFCNKPHCYWIILQQNLLQRNFFSSQGQLLELNVFATKLNAAECFCNNVIKVYTMLNQSNYCGGRVFEILNLCSFK